MESTFLKALMNMWGTAEMTGKLRARPIAEMLATPAVKLERISSSLMSSTSAGKTLPLSIRCFITRRYEKGLMFILTKRAAWEAVTLSPTLKISTACCISMAPFTILVGMFRVWKKEVWEGSRPVGPAGMVTATGAMAPARAGAPTSLSLRTSKISENSALVKTKPRLPLMRGTNFSKKASSSCSTANWRKALLIMVFLPKRTTAFPRRSTRTFWSCLEVTLSACTVQQRL
mmetsp:Transcript_36188/g.94121  ORF Transcript_36188/g.94121 Transcript_36188/m.94121 type:complete len:231 (+) Transcript_36188:234-926(+)